MATVISIASGKGGVGKSSLAVNFALRLQVIKGKTLLVDADLLMANSHILLDYQPQYDIVDVLDGRCLLQDAIQEIPGTISLLPGRIGASSTLAQETDPIRDFIPQIKARMKKFDYVVVDVPAGAGQGVMNSLSQSDHVVVVLLGQATSFVDAYALIKNAYMEHSIKKFSLVVNMAENETQAKTIFENFQRTVCGFLPVSLTYCGCVPQRKEIYRSSIDCRPVVQVKGESRQIGEFDAILKKILAAPCDPNSHQAPLISSLG
jgi:flagellar biosynthesis protein FlhG